MEIPRRTGFLKTEATASLVGFPDKWGMTVAGKG